MTISMLTTRALGAVRELKPVAKSDAVLHPAVASAARAAGLSTADAQALDVNVRACIAAGKPVTPIGAVPPSLYSSGLLDRSYPSFGPMKVQPGRTMQRAIAAAAVPVAKAEFPAPIISHVPPTRLPPPPAGLMASSLGVRSTTSASRSAPAATSLASAMGVRNASPATVTAKKADTTPPPAAAPAPSGTLAATMAELAVQMARLKTSTDALAEQTGASCTDAPVTAAKSAAPPIRVSTASSRPTAPAPVARMVTKSDGTPPLVPVRLPPDQAWRRK